MTKPSPNTPRDRRATLEQVVHIPAGTAAIEGALALPPAPAGLVLFAHGSGSSRHSPRNNYVARVLQQRDLGTLLLDLLTPEEDQDMRTRFDIPLLTERLLAATRWVRAQPAMQASPLGYFGASTGAAAALMAAATLGPQVQAVVSRGGRPDLAGRAQLAQLQCPVLLLVGGRDEEVLALNRLAAAQMRCPHEIVVIPGATHLFEEAGTLEAVAQCAADWFVQYLAGPAT